MIVLNAEQNANTYIVFEAPWTVETSEDAIK